MDTVYDEDEKVLGLLVYAGAAVGILASIILTIWGVAGMLWYG